MQKNLSILLLFMLLYLSGCGGEDSSLTGIKTTPNPLPARPILSPETIKEVINTDKEVTSVIGSNISFNSPDYMENLIKEIKSIYGVEDVYVSKDTLSVMYVNGGIRNWTNKKASTVVIHPDLPDVTKPPDIKLNSKEIINLKDSIKSNKVILINAFSDKPSRINDIICLDSIETWFENYINYDVTRLNGQDVNINSFKSLNNYGIIIYNGDGNFVGFTRKDSSQEYITLIQTNENCVSIENDGYWDDWYNYRVVVVNSTYYITNKFFDYYYYGKKFPGSIFYNGASKGTKGEESNYPMCASLYNQGISACIGWSGNQSIGMDTACVLFNTMIFDPNNSTIGEAINAMDSQYTQQTIENETAYLGYYPAQAVDMSVFLDTGNSFNDANVVTLPYKGAGIINPSNGDNYYRINISNPSSILTAKIMFDNNRGNLELYLYDSLYNEIANSKNSGGNQQLIVEKDVSISTELEASSLPAGTYYIVIKGNGSSNSYILDIGSDAIGYNFTTASDVNLPYSANHKINSAGVDNYYKVNLINSLSLTIHMSFAQSGGNLNLYLYNQSQNEIYKIEDLQEDKVINTNPLTGGIYYVVVKGNGNVNTYNLTISATSGVGHSFESATEVSLPYTANHWIEANEIDNFYKVTLSTPSHIKAVINFSVPDGDLDLYLFNSSRKLIGSSEGIGDEETVSGRRDKETKDFTASMLPAGNYYIKVHGYFGSLNNYTIAITNPVLPVCSSVIDSNGDNKDENNSYSPVYFTVKGKDFGDSILLVNGKVTFTNVDTSEEINGDISSWTDSEISGVVVIPAGKYWVHVIVLNYTSTDEVFYFKGVEDITF